MAGRLGRVRHRPALAASLALTAYLGWRRRLAAIMALAISGVLMLVDAWFDVTTSQAADRRESVLWALLVEVPFAVIMLGISAAGLRRVSRAIAGLVSSPRLVAAWTLHLDHLDHLDHPALTRDPAPPR